MPATPLPRVLKDMLSLPTAPFVEHAVAEYVRTTLERLDGVTLTTDHYGNLLAHFGGDKQDRDRKPLVFTAHMDHPGFEALGMNGKKSLVAAFRGWVEPEFFPGTRVRFWTPDGWVAGRVREVTKAAKVYRMIGRTARPEEVRIDIARDVPAGSPGMWDLPDPQVHGELVHARACDDLAGCASMVALLERLSRKEHPAEVYCLFTRAEEVGFVGAIGAARLGTIPLELPVIAIETSKALPQAPLGNGPILRVGDKSAVFSPELTAYCNHVASNLASRRKAFAYQRALMDGGTCESTAYLAYGYVATGVCIPLGNYHNMDTKRRRIAAEQIHLNDWKRMVDWFEALVIDPEGFRPSEISPLRKTIDERFDRYLPMLEKSSGHMR